MYLPHTAQFLFINISELLDKAFARFSHPEIAPIKKLKNGLNIMELFHGTTWAFKDLALSCVGQFLEYFLSKRQKHLTIVVGKVLYVIVICAIYVSNYLSKYVITKYYQGLLDHWKITESKDKHYKSLMRTNM